jgi:two-component system OmpR family response regulator
MSSTRILCVEDDPDSCEMLTAVLRQSGYDVKTAITPGDGIIMLKAYSFDLIILDNWYPDTTGPGLCRSIRAFDKATPIIFYSGAAIESDISEALDAGAQGYVIKPYVTDLLDKVKRLTQHVTSAPS